LKEKKMAQSLNIPEPAKKSQRTIFQEYSEALVVAIILAIIIRAVLIQAFKIPSGSMEPTLLIGDHILVNKLVYGVRIPFTNKRFPNLFEPEKSDVIVFVYPEDRTKDFIKRVVATGGDTIEIKNKKVFINGKESIISGARFNSNVIMPGELNPRDNMQPVKVPDGFLFVMGDNRDFSHDSRFWGFVPLEDVKGKAFLIYYSAQDMSKIRWDRIFKLIR
jgi:signal peptidase I